MLMQVCRELGLTLAEGQEKITAFELRLWLAFFKKEAEMKKEAYQNVSRRHRKS